MNYVWGDIMTTMDKFEKISMMQLSQTTSEFVYSDSLEPVLLAH